jgi:CheY-like chemotaxis protein
VTEHGARPLVLVVDDEQDVLTYLAAALEDEGFDVATASNAEDAEQVLNRRQPDLLVLDIMMPGHSGLALFQRVRSDPTTAGIPVVFLSACSAADVVRTLASASNGHGREPGVVSYFEKPVVLPSFLEAARAQARGARVAGPKLNFLL